MTSSSLNISGIRDNHHRGSIGDFLEEKILQGSDLSFVSAYFTIYAYAALKNKLDQIQHLRFLFGEPQLIQSLDPDKTEKKAFRIEDDSLAPENKLISIHEKAAAVTPDRDAKLCAGKAAPYQALCDLFDQETESGVKMDKYSDLLTRAVKSIVHTFQKRTAAGLQSGRNFVIPNKQEQATESSDFELITWLVIKSGKEND